MLTGISAFVPSEILHDWQSSSRQRYSVSIVFQTSFIESYAESNSLRMILGSKHVGAILDVIM